MSRSDESREAILCAVRLAKPEPVDLPELRLPTHAAGDLVRRFTLALEAASGAVWRVGEGGVETAVASVHPQSGLVASADDVWGFERLEDHQPSDIDVLVCLGVFGVAENGAVWVPESRMGVRAAPYLAQHLVLVLHAEEIVTDMHAAYARLDVDAEGFGAFIAGPSKTADIEQSLVIGAHGPRSLTVLLT